MREASFQQRAAEIGVSPVIIDINPVKKYIVMEKMDETLFDIIKKNKGVIPITYQKQIFTIFNKLDRIGILHGDPNSTNFMIKGRKLYIIDYGFAKEIDKKLINKYGTNKLNRHLMIFGFILQLREIFGNALKCKYLKSKLSKEQILQLIIDI